MLQDLWMIILGSAEAAFIDVTVFVGAVLLFFGYIDYKQQGAFIETVEKAKKYQPFIGALLGILPGCGGSILLMPLYIKGSVSFGTIVATLLATAGDAAFVIMTQAPREFVLITIIGLVVGTITGYIVDYYNIGAWVRKRSAKTQIPDVEREHDKAEALLDELYCEEPLTCRSSKLRHIGHEEGDEIDLILHHAEPLDPTRLGYKITHNCYIIFWAVLAVGLVFGVLSLFQLDLEQIVGLPNIVTWVGVLGTVVSIAYMTRCGNLAQAQSHEDVEHKLFSLKETLIHNAQETAFVGTWVFIAYLVYELAVYFVGGEQVVAAVMTSAGLASVVAGVLVGLIPGCGPQVIFVSLYLRGMFPFAALLANSLSQDGDALFPLLAMDRNSAFWATVVNTIPAFVVGVIVYFIELGLG
ncbi:MAG: putative manganese transporter [Bacillota bacterium]|jgi:hypothetical protein|nr:arsenic efflux protein [Candidatus Fermentithermobacillaceae bacterium]HOA70545.1 putative manganese transporter [Bacillota bacterium]HPT34899.1 putative manganese transporter [Bacillota bacterium]HPZ84892.1 putative manganese transporter [Bacillota bacterium]HQD85516.1 putative manganese transporter [Bacillota bacterium]